MLTDINALFRQLESRILSLDGVQLDSEWQTISGLAYKAPAMMSRQFVAIRPCKSHVSLNLYIPFDKINDPKGKCYKRDSKEFAYVTGLSSDEDLDYIMGLIEQAYTYNLVR